MIKIPPRCSKEWTLDERRRLVAFWLEVVLNVIAADNPEMPVVEKQSMQMFLTSMHQILTYPADRLELDRAALEKPFDPSQMFQRVWVDETMFQRV